MSTTISIEASEYTTFDGATAHRVTDGEKTILITPPRPAGGRWEVWYSDSLGTLARTRNADEGIARARAILEHGKR